MDVLANLCARSNGCPSVDHGAVVDVGADIDVGWHQNDITPDECATANTGRGHNAGAGGFEVILVEVDVLERNLVVVASPFTRHHIGGGERE